MKAVILAGGSGTRLWPLSRAKKPKQFQPLISQKTLFQETLDRLDFLTPNDIYIALNKEHLEEVKKQAPHIPKENLIIEPALRDTASCIGFAAAYIGKKHPNEVMSVIYADHIIRKKEEFIKKLKIAGALAQKKHTLNIIEVKATHPTPHLGYVKIGPLLETVEQTEIFALDKFIEKPDKATAEKFLTSYKYLWNTGYFVWRIKDILALYKKHLPDTYEKLMTIQKHLGTEKETETIQKYYPKLKKISIDYAIMEKVDPSLVRIIPADLGWSDIGNFETLFTELTSNKDENITKGTTLNIETKGTLIYNFSDTIITTVGLKDIIIVNTDDALLICPKEYSKDIKRLTTELKKKHPKLL